MNKKLFDTLCEGLKANIEELSSVVNEVYWCNGSLEFLTSYSMDDFDDVMGDYTPTEITCMMFYGEFNPNHDLFRFNGYGNLESFGEYDLLDELESYITDIANAIIDADMIEQVVEYMGIDIDLDEEEE